MLFAVFGERKIMEPLFHAHVCVMCLVARPPLHGVVRHEDHETTCARQACVLGPRTSHSPRT